MAKWNYKVRLKINRFYVAQAFNPVKGYDVEFYDWNYNGTECTASFVCSDDYSNPIERHTKEDMEEYVISKFGANIIKDWSAREDKNLAGNNTPINNPLLDRYRKDTYKSYYDLLVSKEQLEETSRALSHVLPALKGVRHISPFKVVSNSSYKPDNYVVRIGQW
ncbi:MAG TPA: hypothetical protein VEV83_15490 [Parafilimonas sp.]|nr:hypothetical protein [Parafilimonas sp.]